MVGVEVSLECVLSGGRSRVATLLLVVCVPIADLYEGQTRCVYFASKRFSILDCRKRPPLLQIAGTKIEFAR